MWYNQKKLRTKNLKGQGIMDKIKICHGSEYIIREPIFGKGKSTNDYGKGFYCTEDIELAKEWACSRNNDGFANVYELDCKGLNILKLNGSPYNILNWLAILAANRTYWERTSISENAKKYLHKNFLIDVSEYDIIIGYRANDSYFTFAKNFVSNTISIQQLQVAMRLGQLGEQIVLKSEKAFKRIKFITFENAIAEIYYGKKVKRDKTARQKYVKYVKNTPNNDDLFMIDIMREGIKNGDSRLL